MNTLTTALFAEGSTDERFLAALIQRVLVDILHTRGRQEFDVLPPRVLNSAAATRVDQIVDVAQQSYGSHILFVHADADGDTAVPARRERIEPGVERIDQMASTTELCRQVVPIIPIHMIEAWLLADGEMLVAEIGTNLTLAQLQIPQRVHQLETLADPKTELKRIIDEATHHSRSRRRRPFEIGSLYTPLGERIELAKLAQLSAYKQFITDLSQILLDLNFIAPDTQSRSAVN